MNSSIKNKVQGNKPDLYTFLDNYRVGKDSDYTHTSWTEGKGRGKYFILDDKMDQFNKLYCKECLKSQKEDRKIGIIEKHCDVGPIVIDIDFKFDITNRDRQYTDEHVKKIVELYMNEIDETFSLSIEGKAKDMVAFIMEKKEPYEHNGIIKDGIHIIFPHIISMPEVQYLIRENVMKNCGQKKILDDLPLKNQLNDVFDRAVIEKNGWFMFGSSKPYSEPYLVTKIYNQELDKMHHTEVEYDGIVDLPVFLSIRRHKMKDATPVKQDKIDELERKNKNKHNLKLKLQKVQTSNYDIKQITQLVGILSDDRGDDQISWMEVGWCLHNIDPNNRDLLDLWIEFSKKSKKFKSGECEKIWPVIRRSGNGKQLGIGSLYFWAQKDNKTEYMKIKRQDIRFHINNSTNCTNYDVAKVLYEMYKHRHVCVSIKSKVWYEYKDHRWYEDDDGHSLRKNISTELVNEYIRVISEFNIILAKIDSDDAMSLEDREKEKNKYEEKTKQLTAITVKLKTTNFKDNVMKECRELFYNREFVNKLDENLYLIGFENGVYDLKIGEFRDGNPDDYISMTTKNDYIPYDENDEHYDNIMEFFNQIFPNYNVREYALKVLASHLQGYNAEEKFRIWTGVGGNGKGKINELFLLTLGDYGTKFPTTLLTGRRAASNAVTPEIAQSKGKRYCYFDEPDENERINVGLMKEFTGNDKIKARSLFKEPIEFKPQFKMILLCNDLPKVPPYDGGTWRRLEVVEFVSKFVDNPKEDNEFPIDMQLSEKLRYWKETFMAILLEYYKKYKVEGVRPPDEVTKFTLDYQSNCDNYADFFSETFEKAENKKEIIAIERVYKEYKDWFDQNNPGIKMAQQKDILSYLEKRFGKRSVINKNLRGFQIKEKKKENEEDDEIINANVSLFSL